MTDEKPTGTLSAVIFELRLRAQAAQRHVLAEGHDEVAVSTVLNSYDRVEHPYLHGRRPYDIVAKIRGWIRD